MKITYSPSFAVSYYTVFHSTERRIRDFGHFTDGWHFGEGKEFEIDAIQEALKLHQHILECGFFETNAFPGLDGEIQMTVYSEHDYFQFERDSGGVWEIIHEQAGATLESLAGLDFEHVVEFVKTMRQKLWNAFASYHSMRIGIELGGNSATLHSGPTKMIEAYPSLTELVLSR